MVASITPGPAEEETSRAHLSPWHMRPCRLVSWWEIEQFGARDFFGIVQALSNLQAVFREDQNTLKGSDLHRGVEDWLISMERDCRKVGLGVSTKLISLPKVLSGERVP